jgi:diguanylate cyclase (GGDEF)-like protein
MPICRAMALRLPPFARARPRRDALPDDDSGDRFVHRCSFCGWSRPGRSSTVVSPRCPDCGCTLEGLSVREAERADDHGTWRPPSRNPDVTAAFAVIAAGPFLLPVVGVEVADLAFVIPLTLLLFASLRCRAAARRSRARRGMWTAFGVGALFGAGASFLAVVAAMTDTSGAAAFYLGAGGTLGLLLGMAIFVRAAFRDASAAAAVDAALISSLVFALGVYFVVLPGATRGDPLLTGVFGLDLVALVLGLLGTFARRAPGHRRLGLALVTACAGATLGDAFVSAAVAGQLPALTGLTALLWAVAGYALAAGADGEFRRAESEPEPEERVAPRRWVAAQVLLPLATVLAFPTTALVLWLAGELTWTGAVYFGIWALVALFVVFGRQAHVLLDNQRAVWRERRLRRHSDRRNEELEALTGLATTMTQTLEEAPIIEQALEVLHLAARASSAALHTWTGETLRVRAVAGSWSQELAWGGLPPHPRDFPQVELRGGRQVIRMPLLARGQRIGLVTLIRPGSAPADDDALRLLRLLVDEMAVAVQNARDYREKLEQAIRDPLTGLYNRRFFFEALNKEVHRSERYGSAVSLVIFDVDNFKGVNDMLGHATGDEVLRRVGALASRLVRPVDSVARIGGEEFALLLPETDALGALVVAERVRTAISRQGILPGHKLTVSAGVACCPQDTANRAELQRKADAALYWAKRNGKNLCALSSEVVIGDEPGEREAMLSHLYALVSAIDSEHLQTRDHSENVAAYAVAMGQAVGMDGEAIVRLRRAAMLHDVGKVAVAADVLNKPAQLTPKEWEEIRMHPVVGGRMLLHAGLEEEARWVRHHHERMDGQGYPDRLAGELIPLEARILFVADSFEAMTSDRPYHRGIPVEEAVAELHRCAGTQFDRGVVGVLAGLIERGEIAVLALREGGAASAQSAEPEAVERDEVAARGSAPGAQHPDP